MQWVWPTARFMRLSLRQQFPCPTSGASLLPPLRGDPLLPSSGRRPFLTQAKRETGITRHEFLPRHPKLHILEDRTAAEDSKHPVNSAQRLEADEHRKANKIAETSHEGDTPECAKDEGPTITSEYAVSVKPEKNTNTIVNAGEPVALDLGTDYETTEKCSATSNRTTAGDKPVIRPAGRGWAFNDCKLAQEPPATTLLEYTGFSVDARGQLRIASSTLALRKRRTALIVTSVSRNLMEADFIRLMGHTSDRANDQAGFIRGTVDEVIYQAVLMLMGAL